MKKEKSKNCVTVPETLSPLKCPSPPSVVTELKVFFFKLRISRFRENFGAKYCMRNDKFRAKMDPFGQKKNSSLRKLLWAFHQKP